MRQSIFLFSTLLLFNLNVFSQKIETKIDSFQKLIKVSKGQKQLDFIYELGVLYASNSNDSVKFSKKIITDKAGGFNSGEEKFNFKIGLVDGYYSIEKLEESKSELEEVFKNITDKKTEARYYKAKAFLQQSEDNFENAKTNYLRAISIFKSLGAEEDLIETYNNIAACAQQLGQYEEAITYQQNTLKLAEKFNSNTSISKSLNNLSVLYQKLDDLETSEKYILRAIKMDEDLNDRKGLAGSYVNLGIVNRKLSAKNNDNTRFIKAKESYKTALKIAEEENLSRIKAASLANLANLENDKGNFKSAIVFGKQSVAFSQKQKNVFGEMISRLNLGRSYRLNSQFNKAETELKLALEIAERIKFQRGIQECYRELSHLYSDTKKFEIALDYYKDLTRLKDSISSVQVKNNINDIEIKYETEKKESEILQQRAVIAEKEVVLQRRNYQIYGALGLALILGLIGYLFYNQQRLKNQQLEKENQLRDALVKIETQNQLQDQRLRISRDLHDNIGAQLTFIISSIDNLKYGFDIKDNKLNNKLETISSFASSTIYELRDTIWAMNKDKISFEDLQTRISNYIDKADFSDSNTTFSFNVGDRVNLSKAFTSVEGMNIYRIIQETINNSLKYAEASEIEVNVNQATSHLIFKISDNGKGFNPETIDLGNGLNNMKKRASEINANFKIDSEIDKGTTTTLTL